MTRESKQLVVGSSSGVLAVMAIGGLLGYVLAGDILEASPYDLLTAFVLGLVWSFLFIQWLDLIAQTLAFYHDPIPMDLDIQHRDTVREHLARLRSGRTLVIRCRNLLDAWAREGKPSRILQLAATQSLRSQATLRAGYIFALLLLFVALWKHGNPALSWGGVILLGITIFTRQRLLERMDEYIESHFLVRLPGHIPHLAFTAAELADSLGGAINQAFKDHVPQPERTAEAVKVAVEAISRSTAAEIERLYKAMSEQESVSLEKWIKAEKETATRLRETETALATIATELTGGLGRNAEKIQAALADQAKALDHALGSTTTQLKDTFTTGVQSLQKTLGHEVEGLGKTLAGTTGQLKTTFDGGVKQLQDTLGGETRNLGKAFGDATGQLKTTFDGGVQQLNASLSSQAKDMEKAITGTTGQLKDTFKDGVQQLQGTLSGQAKELDKALSGNAAQLKDLFGVHTQQLNAALMTQAKDLEKSLTAMNAQIEKTFHSSADQLQSTLHQHAMQIEKSGQAQAETMKTVLTEQASALQAAGREIAAQLTKIMQLEQDIQKLLHIQEVVDGTIKAVASTEEFRQTLNSLRTHIEAGDKLIREASKPRHIKLVEAQS